MGPCEGRGGGMWRRVKVLVPLHVTAMWLPVYTDNPLTTGSIGVGVLLKPGVVVEVETGSGGRGPIPHISAVLKRLGLSASVRVSAPVPLGAGYGLSAAYTLGAALGASALAGRPLLEAAQVAHVVEVEMRSGLGDVIAEFYGGGIEVRVRPGAPGVGVVDKVPHPRGVVVLAHTFGTEETSHMLIRLREVLSDACARLVEKFLESPTYEAFLELSAEFSRTAGFLTREIEERVLQCKRWVEGYYAKKGVLLILVDADVAEEARHCLHREGVDTRLFQISHAGAIVIRDVKGKRGILPP